MHIVLRTNLPASALAPTLERAVRAVNPSVPIVGLREMDAVFDESIGRPRLLAQLLGAFAGLALLLAVLGTYGVLSFMVAERRREIGIRVAIGATRGSIVALVTKQGLVIVSIGLAVGLGGCAWPEPSARIVAVRRGDRRIRARLQPSRPRLRSLPRWRADSRRGAPRGSTRTSCSEGADETNHF